MTKPTTCLIACALIAQFAFAAPASMGGTDIGGTPGSMTYTANWCNNQIELLKKYLKRSQTAKNDEGMAEANSLLHQGLQAALKKGPYKKAQLSEELSLGLSIADEINASDKTADDITLEVKNRILESFYNYLIRDINVLSRSEKTQSDDDLVQFTQIQSKRISWLLTTLTSTMTETLPNGTQISIIFPTDSHQEFLHIAMILSQFIATEIKSSLYDNALQCQVMALEDLSSSIREHLGGNSKAIGKGDKRAVNSVALELKDINEAISTRTCATGK